VDAYSRMELCTPIWLNHDLGDGGVVDISTVDANYGVEVYTLIFLMRKSFSKKSSKLKWTHPLIKLNTTRVDMWIIFGSSRNVYDIEESY
jgi:hypothetical protein